MPLIQRSERSSHWYTRDGKSMHTVIAKKTGLPRSTNITDARKLDLVPSVTNILAMKSKPALETWKIDKAIIAAADNPQKDGEPREVWLSRIAEMANEESRKAAEFGTMLHDGLEAHLTGEGVATGETEIFLRPTFEWLRENIVQTIDTEQSFVADEGFAGRRDLYAVMKHNGQERRAVIDFKTQRFKGKADATFYKEWSMQLAAYARPLSEGGEPLLVSIAIPSDAPGRPCIKVWDNASKAWHAFLACFDLWKFEKDYYPGS
jgi:hypothetical protein